MSLTYEDIQTLETRGVPAEKDTIRFSCASWRDRDTHENPRPAERSAIDTAAVFTLLAEFETDFITDNGHRVQISFESDGTVNTEIESLTGTYERHTLQLMPRD